MSLTCLVTPTQMQVSRKKCEIIPTYKPHVDYPAPNLVAEKIGVESQCGGPDDSNSTCLLRTKNALRGITKIEVPYRVDPQSLIFICLPNTKYFFSKDL
jgi:hypothetical protein